MASLHRLIILSQEQFHSTPETQTDESYVHPEDIEHFAQHESIEREEARREAKFQGISVEEALAQHDPHVEPPIEQQPGEGSQEVQNEGQQAPDAESAALPKITRSVSPEKLDPEVRFKDAQAEGEWGKDGYKPPRSPSDKLKYV